jgi:hypothetical protein
MAIYKIFPEKSATLYSYYPTLNTGQDEILELSTFSTITSTNEVSRVLIKFPSSELDAVYDMASGSNFDAYLKMYLANASEIPLDFTLYSYPLAADWNVGTGRLSNSPITTDGVSWQYKDQLSGSVWFTTSSFTFGTTGSYRSGSNVGGGLWYSSSAFDASQSFTNTSTLDVEMKVTAMFDVWARNTSSNYGLILKHSSSLEFTTASKLTLQYFSANTHTIYPPCLEVRWDDSVYNTGSLSVVDSDLYVTSLGNNKNKYNQDSVQRFRVKARAKYPPRTFTTGSFSFNLVNYALPSSSYWSIKDLDTEEIVVDYDTSYTKISCDPSGSYFDVYMNGLEPERYYKVLFKSILSNGETVIFDENYYFKVIR